MSDQQQTHCSNNQSPSPSSSSLSSLSMSSCPPNDDITDPTKNSKCSEDCCEVVRPPHIPDGHTFLVTTVNVIETTITERHVEEQNVIEPNRQTTIDDADADKPTCSKAIVPISSSLPSKLLRFHARRASALSQNTTESLDSQFSSDEGAPNTDYHTDTDNNSSSDDITNDCADIFDSITPTAPSLSPIPQLPALSLPATVSSSSEERLIDVGMGSSIEGSEESEEDDELKPLPSDNHVVNDPPIILDQSTSILTSTSVAPIVLSEENLEIFRKHHHHQQQQQQQQHNHHHYQHHNNNINNNNSMDNIYLHPNFKHDYDENICTESSPPPAVAPANSPVEQRRVHRSFLTMKKSTESPNVDLNVNNVATTTTTTATASTNTDPNDLEDNAGGINEVDTLDASLIPNDELAAALAEAVEFYFSNESILKDAFLLKHVRRNKEGFVSLKLVSSFKRVRQFTKDWRVVGWAVRAKSTKIELNDMGTKVRRLEPLPTFDETMPSRTIVACDLPLDKLTIEKVSDIFAKCGEIALIRILKPGMAIPVDVRQFMNKYPEMMQKECALVEYVESSSAREARNLQGPFQVFEMVAPKKKTGKKAIIQVAAPIARMVENYRYYNDASYERTRGGSFSGVSQQHDFGDLRYKLKRNNSDYPGRNYGELPQQHQQHHPNHHHQQQQQQQSHYNQSQHYHSSNNHHYQSPHHRGSFGEHSHQFQHYQQRGSIGNDSVVQDQAHSPSGNFFAYSPRRYSNTSTISANTAAALGDSNANGNASSPSAAAQTSSLNSSSNNSAGGSYAHVAGQHASTRRLSNCSDNYTGYTESSRRPSNCSEHVPQQRRDSSCSESCPCSRRISDFGQTESYRKTSQCSIGSSNNGGGERRLSNGSLQFERTTFSSVGNAGDTFGRRMSNDYNYERKPSLEPQQTNYDDGNVGGGGGGYNVFPRRYSNNFNVGNKLAAYDNAQYINGRRISTDSGYDRRYSFGSEYEGSPRSRTGSFLSNYKHGGVDIDGQPRSRTNSFLDGSPRSRSGSLAQRNAENLVRTPIGPDGSKGFGSRARKFGQTISPVN